MVGLEDSESPFNHLQTKKMITEKYLVRHYLRIQQCLEDEELDNVYWLPGTENPAGGMTKEKSDMLPMLTPSDSAGFRLGILQPLHGVSSSKPAKVNISTSSRNQLF